MYSRKFNNKKTLKEEIGRLFAISFGVFLFILFFQPFPLNQLDFNDRLLYVTGFGAIVFALACIVLVIIPILMPKWFQISEWENEPSLLLNIILFIFSVTAFMFYIRFVGRTPLTLYIMFKIILVCAFPIITLRILYRNKSLERIIEKLKKQNKEYIKKLGEIELKNGEEEIDVYSSNKSDKIRLRAKDIVAVKSADNYVEVFYFNSDSIEKKLLRNTLKDIESQLSNLKKLIRCHRTCIVNTKYIDNLKRNYSGYYLQIKNCDEKLPVSRQYLLQVREALSIVN